MSSDLTLGDSDSGINRRSFIKTAVAMVGSGAVPNLPVDRAETDTNRCTCARSYTPDVTHPEHTHSLGTRAEYGVEVTIPEHTQSHTHRVTCPRCGGY